MSNTDTHDCATRPAPTAEAAAAWLPLVTGVVGAGPGPARRSEMSEVSEVRLVDPISEMLAMRTELDAVRAERERLLTRLANAETAHDWELERANKLRETVWAGSEENDKLRAELDAMREERDALRVQRDEARIERDDAYQAIGELQDQLDGAGE